MRKFLIVGLVVAVVAVAGYFGVIRREQAAAAAGQGQPAGPAQAGGAGQRGGGPGGGFGGGGFRPPMTVEVVKVGRGAISAHLSVVGSLIGEATVDVAPKTGGRLTTIAVKLGDRVRRGQLIGKVEDRELVEQVRQAEASQTVGEATIRQREADLNLALTNVERSRNLYGRQLLPKQTLDDAEARYTSAVAQVDLARAQLAQSASRLQELRINLANTSVVSPVDGFVARRNVDPGAWVSQNAPLVSVVDISSLRLVANVVEKDLKMVGVGDRAVVEVDAFPGETFTGRIARVSPILDPATRTAQMEVEIPNRDFRLKPGMYAKVNLEIENRPNVLLLPKVALVDSEGQRGVFQPSADNRATFKAVKLGIEDSANVEVLEGLSEGEIVIAAGAGSLRRDDQLTIAGQDGPSGGRAGGSGEGGRPGMGGRQRGGSPGGANRQAAPDGQPPPAAAPGRPPQGQRQMPQPPTA